jgi:acid phosphatase family membrane protein YuiD
MDAFLRYSPWLSAAVLAWLLAQTLKMIASTIATRHLDFSRLVDTGGMPSSHTAFVAALTTAIGMTEGWHSAAFAIVLCFSLIILYDATNLRRSAGYQAQVLNTIVPQLLKGKILKPGIQFPKLHELLGHSPFEVFVGATLGVAVALWLFHKLGI